MTPLPSLLCGPRVALRALEPEDLEWLYTIENDATLWAVGAHHAPYSRFALKQYIANNTYNIYSDGQLRFVVETLPDAFGCREAIGLVDIFDFDPQNRRAEVGIVLMQSYRGKGLGVESLRLLADYARVELQLHQIYAYVDVANQDSTNAFQGAGFQCVVTLEDWLHRADGYSDANFFCRKL